MPQVLVALVTDGNIHTWGLLGGGIFPGDCLDVGGERKGARGSPSFPGGEVVLFTEDSSALGGRIVQC